MVRVLFTFALLFALVQGQTSDILYVASPSSTPCAEDAYPTIEAALAAGSVNQVIQLCPGTFTESPTINYPVRLRGSRAGNLRTSFQGVLTITNQAVGTSVKDIDFLSQTDGTTIAVQASGVVIANNSFSQQTTTSDGPPIGLIIVETSAAYDVYIQNNTFGQAVGSTTQPLAVELTRTDETNAFAYTNYVVESNQLTGGALLIGQNVEITGLTIRYNNAILNTTGGTEVTGALFAGFSSSRVSNASIYNNRVAGSNDFINFVQIDGGLLDRSMIYNNVVNFTSVESSGLYLANSAAVLVNITHNTIRAGSGVSLFATSEDGVPTNDFEDDNYDYISEGYNGLFNTRISYNIFNLTALDENGPGPLIKAEIDEQTLAAFVRGVCTVEPTDATFSLQNLQVVVNAIDFAVESRRDIAFASILEPDVDFSISGVDFRTSPNQISGTVTQIPTDAPQE